MLPSRDLFHRRLRRPSSRATCIYSTSRVRRSAGCSAGGNHALAWRDASSVDQSNRRVVIRLLFSCRHAVIRLPSDAADCHHIFTRLSFFVYETFASGRRCSWLYIMRACLDAERIIDPTNLPSTQCSRMSPPKHKGKLGWGSVDIDLLSDMNRLLFEFRCW